ncbi:MULTISPECIES: TOMM precursor leader peptide-binding protein [Corynebacterium]|uniref:TOMM precursor leader peptide-binding protein n=1 Tax=Corynebacterium TaxID=1716 RepID=UPI00124C3D2D|nr:MULTISPECIES: TOMM precursor leader peptide-binding protein [Corynebacterium]
MQAPAEHHDTAAPRAIVRLREGISVFIRPCGALQFGQNPQTAVVIDEFSPVMGAAIARCFRRVHRATPRTQLSTWLEEAGMAGSAARSLIDDLLQHRILEACPDSGRTASLIGRSPLATQVAGVLSATGVSLHQPQHPDFLAPFVHDIAQLPTHPVLVIDEISQHRFLAPLLTQLITEEQPLIVVDVIDGHYCIGPMRRGTRGPCPLCMELYRSDADPAWSDIVAQRVPHKLQPSPITTTATAAVIAALVQAIHEGSQPELVRAGTRWTVTHTAVQEDTVAAHPICPVCFEASQRRPRARTVSEG